MNHSTHTSLSKQSLSNFENELEQENQNQQIDASAFQQQESIPFNQPFEVNSQQNNSHKKRGRKAVYDGAQYPDLIDKAKLILPQHNYDISKLLELAEFKPLKDSKDLPRFISKYILNKTSKSFSKSVRAYSVNGLEVPRKIRDELSAQQQKYVPFQTNKGNSFGQQNSLTPQANYGAKIQSELTSNYLREYMLLKPTERYQFIEEICQRNSQSLLEFLINLKTTCSSTFCEGMFGLIHELNQNSKMDLQIKTRLFVQSLLYYRNELIVIEQDLLKNSMVLLAQRPNSEQTLGLANYIFINEVEFFSQLQEELVLLDSKNIGIIPLMVGTFAQFQVDAQVIRLLPNTLQCLNKPFIQVLKQNKGLRLIGEIPVNVVGDFVQICALSQSKTYLDLDAMINSIKDIFIKKWEYLDQSDFSLLIAQVSVELKERNPNWIGKLTEIVNVVRQVTFIQIEKGIKNRPDIIADLISGNQIALKQILKNPKQVEDLTGQQFYKMVGKFKKLNKGNEDAFNFCCDLQENMTLQGDQIRTLEQQLGFNFLSLQKLCLSYVMWSKSRYQFINFGIGNGKTLLCAMIGVTLCVQKQLNTIILGKNDYLVLRDEKRFEKLILNSNVKINYNQYGDQLGVYFMTQKYFETQTNDQRFLSFLRNSVLIIDEYDWVIFEGSTQLMADWIKCFRTCSQLIGLTGSTLSQKEETCLEIAFKQKEIKFPLLSMLKSDRKCQLQNLLYNGSQQEYCKSIYELCMKQTLSTPVIIVSSGTYSIIEQYFKKFNELQFYSMKGVKGSKVDAYLEGKFKIQNSNKRYSVLLLTEIQGRGTDLPTTKEIEDNGGLYLIISDVFSKRQTEQIIGRVGRLENKGQYRHMILISGSQDTVEQAIQFRQDFLENESHIKFSKLQTILSQQYEPIKQKDNEISAVTTSMNENQNLDQEEREISAFEDIEIVESYNQAQQNKIASPITQSHGQNDLKQKKGVEYVLQIENNQSTDADVGCLKQVAEQKKQAQSKKVQKRENIMEIDQQAKTQSSISSNLNQKRVQKSILKSNEKNIKTLKQTQSHKEAQVKDNNDHIVEPNVTETPMKAHKMQRESLSGKRMTRSRKVY